jgi:hypothetical protein
MYIPGKRMQPPSSSTSLSLCLTVSTWTMSTAVLDAPPVGGGFAAGTRGRRGRSVYHLSASLVTMRENTWELNAERRYGVVMRSFGQ